MGDKGSGKNNGKGTSKIPGTPLEQAAVKAAAKSRRSRGKGRIYSGGAANILQQTQEDHRQLIVARHIELLTEQLPWPHYTEAMTLLAKQILATYRSMSFRDMHVGGMLQPLQAILERSERELVDINETLLENYWSEWEQVQKDFKAAWARARYSQAQTEVDNDPELRHRLLVTA